MNQSPEDVLRYESEPISAWVALLEHPEAEQRRRAAEKLLEISTAIASVLPALSGVLQDADSQVRARAAIALGELGARMLASIPTLRAALRSIVLADSDAEVRGSALRSLARIGPGAQGDVPSLIGSLKDALPYVRLSAAHALGELGPRARDAI